MVVQPKWRTPMKLKGKAQADPAAGPSVVEQMDLALQVRKAGNMILIPRAGSSG